MYRGRGGAELDRAGVVCESGCVWQWGKFGAGYDGVFGVFAEPTSVAAYAARLLVGSWAVRCWYVRHPPKTSHVHQCHQC